MVIDMNNDTCIEELINGLNMGKIAIDHLVDKIENRKLKEIAVHQRKNYDDLKEKIMQTFPHTEDEIFIAKTTQSLKNEFIKSVKE